MKLLRRKGSRSEKQWENALSVVRTQGARLELTGDLDEINRIAGI